jgi:hypothetical protein
MTTTTTKPTRRAMIGALALAAPFAALPAIATPRAGIAFDAAHAAYRAAEAADAAFQADEYAPAWTAFALALADLPHTTVKTTAYKPYLDWRTDDYRMIEDARRYVTGLKEWPADRNAYVADCRALLAAVEKRTEAIKALEERHAITELNRRSDAHTLAVWEALNRLINDVPASDGEALAIKIEIASAACTPSEMPINADWTASIIRDARNLNQREA